MPLRKAEKEILDLIKKEENEDKRIMLKEVYYNNLRYASTNEARGRLKDVISAMKIVDRRFFIPKSEEMYCYRDEPLSIGHNQTISQPTTVARMLMLSELKKGISILEVGAGSGWNASLASFIVRPGEVTAVERIKALKENAENNFNNFKKGIKEKLNAKFMFTDALEEQSEIWKKQYDRIIVTAGVGIESMKNLHRMGNMLLKQNGLLLFPASEAGSYGAMELWKYHNQQLKKIFREEGYTFVPLLRGGEK